MEADTQHAANQGEPSDVVPARPAGEAAVPLPPQVVRHQALVRDIRTHGAGAGADEAGSVGYLARVGRRQPMDLRRIPASLPVLQAFQDFIEVERRHTRNKILALTLVFAVVLIVIVGGGLLLGLNSMTEFRRSFRDVRGEIETMRKREARDASESDASIREFVATADRLHARLADNHQTLTSVRKELDARTGRIDGAMEGMRDTLSMLESENSALRQNVDAVLAALKQQQEQTTRSRLPATRQAPSPEAAVAGRLAPLVSVPVTVAAAGPHPVTLRMPIPE